MKNVLLGILFLFSVNVNAGLIDINVSADTVAVGDTVTVDLVGTGFADFDSFSFDVLFDTAIFNFDPLSVVTDLTPLELLVLDLPGLGANFSFIDFDFLPFTLGAFNISFDLTVLAAGVSDLSLSAALASQGFFIGDPFDTSTPPAALTLNVNQVDTSLTAVPEPSTIVIFGLAMIGLLSVRRFAK